MLLENDSLNLGSRRFLTLLRVVGKWSNRNAAPLDAISLARLGRPSCASGRKTHIEYLPPFTAW
jgi:hypothetical protein